MSDYIIRRAHIGDVARILDIYAYYTTHTAVSFEWKAPSPEDFTGRFQRISASYPYLVAASGDRILGYAYAGPFVGRAAYLWSAETTIYLAPDAKGRGLGRALYEKLEADLKEMGICNLYACIGVPDTVDEYLSFQSRDFHAHMGFSQVGFFINCGSKFGRWYHMIWMEKIIGEHRTNPELPRGLLA